MEESPFEKYQSKTVILYLEPLLDTYNQTYVSALTLNTMPDGPLSKAVRIFNTPNLSPFQNTGNYTYILMKYPKGNKGISTNWMLSEDIPTVFSFLQSNNYIIDISLTKLMNDSQVNLGGGGVSVTKRMVCMFSFPRQI